MCGSEAKCHVFVEWLHISTYVWMLCGTTDPASVQSTSFFLHLRVIIIIEIVQRCMLSYHFDESADVEKWRIMWKHVTDSDLSLRVKVLFFRIKPRFLHF